MQQDMILELDLGDAPAAKTVRSSRSSNARARVEICPFTIILDSREQLPYTFGSLGLVVPIVVRGLLSGDYSIDGLDSQVAIERKSLEDLYGSCTHGRDRFEREIGCLNEYFFSAVVIEATWPEIADPAATDPTWRSRAVPESILGTITSWSIRYPRVHWWAVGLRQDCEQQVYRALSHYWRIREHAT